MSNKNLIILVALGLIIIAVVAVFLVLNPLRPAGPEQGEEAEITPPEATGKVSDLVEALEKEIIDEMNLVYQEDETDIVISGREEINEFGQAADSTGL